MNDLTEQIMRELENDSKLFKSALIIVGFIAALYWLW